MASSRSTNTMAEFLQRMLGDISQAKTLPDADLEFLIGLETGILQKLRAPVDAMAGQMNGVSPAGPSPDQMGPMPGPLPMSAGGAPPTGGVPGIRSEPAAPNPDELRRMIG